MTTFKLTTFGGCLQGILLIVEFLLDIGAVITLKHSRNVKSWTADL